MRPLYQRLQRLGFNGDGRLPARHSRASLQVVTRLVERIHNAERVNDMKQSMIDRLNELGGQGKPFVFCLDYEMSELILLEKPLAQQELLFDIGGVTNLSLIHI